MNDRIRPRTDVAGTRNVVVDPPMPTPTGVDVDALMRELRRRVEAKKEAGLYHVDALAKDRLTDTEPFAPEEVERIRDLIGEPLDLTVSPSTKPVLGRFVTAFKKVVVRGVRDPLHRVEGRTNESAVALLRYSLLLSRELQQAERRLEELAHAIDVTRAPERIVALEDAQRSTNERLAALAGAALTDRVARLERIVDGRDPSDPAGPVAQLVERTRHSGTDLVDRRPGYLDWLGSAAPLHVDGLDAPHADTIEAGPDPAAAVLGAVVGRATSEHTAALLVLSSLGDGTQEHVLVTRLIEQLADDSLSLLCRELARVVHVGGKVLLEGETDTTAPSQTVIRPDGRRHPSLIQHRMREAGFASVYVDFPDERTPRIYAIHAVR